MARETDLQVTESHFKHLPLVLNLAQPADIAAWAVGAEDLGFCASTIMGLVRMGFITRCVQTSRYSMNG